MRNMIWLLTVIITIFGVYPGQSQAESFIKARGLVWESNIEGSIRVDKGNLAGSSLDLKDTLGMTDSVIVPEVEGKIGFLGTNRYIVSLSSASYEGKKTITKNIRFAGKEFLSSETLRTQLDTSLFSFLYEFAPLPEGVTPSVTSSEPEMGVLLGFKYFHTETQITSNQTGSMSKNFGLPVPVIGIRVQGRLAEDMQLETAGTWMSLKTDAADLYWSDIYGEVKFSAVPKIPFGLGYKINRFNVESNIGPSFTSRLGFKGWYAMASIEF